MLAFIISWLFHFLPFIFPFVRPLFSQCLPSRSAPWPCAATGDTTLNKSHPLTRFFSAPRPPDCTPDQKAQWLTRDVGACNTTAWWTDKQINARRDRLTGGYGKASWDGRTFDDETNEHTTQQKGTFFDSRENTTQLFALFVSWLWKCSSMWISFPFSHERDIKKGCGFSGWSHHLAGSAVTNSVQFIQNTIHFLFPTLRVSDMLGPC